MTLSARLLEIVDALPLKAGMRVIEIGCGPGAMAREIAARIGDGRVLAIDRSARAIALAKAGSAAEMAEGRLEFRCCTAEDFQLEPGELPYDLAVAIRVGALDGRHPKAGILARTRIRSALVAGGGLYIDGGNPLEEIALT